MINILLQLQKQNHLIVLINSPMDECQKPKYFKQKLYSVDDINKSKGMISINDNVDDNDENKIPKKIMKCK